MTENEAIKDIQFLARRYDDLQEVNMSVSQESLDMAIKALEKQIPKKISYQIDENGLKHEKCPTCGSFSVFGNYCTECGQKIDWGKGE